MGFCGFCRHFRRILQLISKVIHIEETKATFRFTLHDWNVSMSNDQRYPITLIYLKEYHPEVHSIDMVFLKYVPYLYHLREAKRLA